MLNVFFAVNIIITKFSEQKGRSGWNNFFYETSFVQKGFKVSNIKKLLLRKWAFKAYWSVALSITITKCTWVDGIADYNIDYVKVKGEKRKEHLSL